MLKGRGAGPLLRANHAKCHDGCWWITVANGSGLRYVWGQERGRFLIWRDDSVINVRGSSLGNNWFFQIARVDRRMSRCKSVTLDAVVSIYMQIWCTIFWYKKTIETEMELFYFKMSRLINLMTRNTTRLWQCFKNHISFHKTLISSHINQPVCAIFLYEKILRSIRVKAMINRQGIKETFPQLIDINEKKMTNISTDMPHFHVSQNVRSNLWTFVSPRWESFRSNHSPPRY